MNKRTIVLGLAALLVILLGAVPLASAKSSCSNAKGFPVWGVNKVNMNLYVTDIPIWYTPAIGPEVEIRLSYNSQAAVVPNAPFGNKWQFNYQSSLSVNAGNVTVTMPDGRVDVYTGTAPYTSPKGVFSTLTKTGTNQYELSFTDGGTYVYDIPSGTTLTNPVLVQIKDAYGNALSLGYNASNQLETITDAQNRTTTIVYTNNLITRVNDPFLRYAIFDYTNGELTRITDMGGYVAELSYQTNPRDNKVYLSSITNKGLGGLLNPAETTSFYIEPDDGLANNNTPYPAPGGAMNNLYRITITSPATTDFPSGVKEEYYYFGPYTWYVAPNDYVAYVDANTNNYKTAKKTLYYLDRTDPKGRVRKIQSPEGGYVEYSNFDDNTATNTGKAKTITHNHDTGTHSTNYEYNAKGHPLTITPPKAGSAVTTITYYPNNIDVQTINNGLGNISFTYNSFHDVTSITDRMGIVTEYGYDDATGKLMSVTRAKGITALEEVTAFAYDSATHNLTSVSRNNATLGSFTYDPIGRVQTQTDASGLTLGYGYDNLNRLTTTTYPDTKTETITYSGCCTKMIGSVTDRAGLVTTYTHDSLKRVRTVTTPQGTLGFDYDKNGNMTKLTDMNLNETLFAYDSDNRLTRKTYANAKYWSYAYDKAGLLLTFTNSRNIVKTYGYDANDNLLSIGYSDTTPGIGYAYDIHDRVTSRTDATGTTAYTYDANGRLLTVDGPLANDTIAYAYDELGRAQSMTPDSGQAVAYAYDTLGRMRTITQGANVHIYDYVGNSGMIQKFTRPNASFTEYAYEGDNSLKRLTSIANKKSTQEIINSFAFTYSNLDLIGTETITNGEALDNFVAGTTTYTPNNLNQTTATTNPNRTYTYDDDGNMTGGYSAEGYPMAMTYDAENRMKSAQYTDGSSVVHRTEYVYGADSFVSEMKKYVNGTLTADSRYLRAGFLPIQERDGSNAITREYTWGLNMGGGIGGLLNLKQGGSDYAYLYDGKGNVASLIDGNQELKANYRYDPFGNVIGKTSLIDQPYMFSTKQFDPQTGQSYYGYRFYDPILGKWTTRDPLGEAGGYNLYGFVGNNPVNFVDPFGLFRFGYRPLGGLGFIPLYAVNDIDDRNNMEWIHEQGWFDDGEVNPNMMTNVGFFPVKGLFNVPGRVREDVGHTRSDYIFRGPIYDDKIMRKALSNIINRWEGSKYNIIRRNCQDFADALRTEYFKLGGTVTWPNP